MCPCWSATVPGIWFLPSFFPKGIGTALAGVLSKCEVRVGEIVIFPGVPLDPFSTLLCPVKSCSVHPQRLYYAWHHLGLPTSAFQVSPASSHTGGRSEDRRDVRSGHPFPSPPPCQVLTWAVVGILSSGPQHLPGPCHTAPGLTLGKQLPLLLVQA